MKLIKSMSLQLKTILFNKIVVLWLFILLHLFLFNINVAEWGDSYRILRASEFVRKGAYPADEKRPPLFSILLAIRPNNVDQVVWGRGLMLVVSVLFYLVFSSFLEKYVKDERFLLIGKLLFVFNPVLLYWSIRIMSDIPFAFLCLLSLYWVCTWGKSFDFGKALLLGFISGISVLLRFEGYLLAASVFIGIIFNGLTIFKQDIKWKKILSTLKSNFPNALTFFITFILTITPYILFRNPLGSSYFEETSGRNYDIKMVWIFLISLIFVLGVIPAIYIIGKKFKVFTTFFLKNISICVFVILETILILLWPAAIPRLFVSIIPLLTIPFTITLKEYFLEKKTRLIYFVIFNSVILMFFIISQFLLKQQFLIPQKWWFVLVVCLQIVLIYTIYLNKFKLFFWALLINLLVWSMSPIYLHKDTFISVKNAATYAAENLSGSVAYNDVSSVSDWYINYAERNGKIVGYYYNAESKKRLTFEALKELGATYLLITNEHNTDMTLDFETRPYLEEIKDFRYNIGGKTFFAKVVKFNKECSQ